MTSSEKMAKILEIQKARGSNDKMAILRRNPELLSIIKAALNPFWQFNIKVKTKIRESITPGTGTFDICTTKLLQSLISRKLSGNAAIAALITELNRMEPLSQELLIRIINKDLSCGLGATSVNKVFPAAIPVFPVQLAKPYESSRMAFPCLISPKIDGLRCVYIKNEDNPNGRLYSRYGHRLIGLDHLADLINTRAPRVTRMDGELTVPGLIFDEISGNIRSFKKSDMARYNVFEAEVYGDIKMPQEYRVNNARIAIMAITDPSIQMVEHVTIASEEEAELKYDEYRRRGYEGAVLKDESALPQFSRSWAWCKMKPADEVDAEVVDIKMGTGKYAGQCGAIICDFNGRLVSVGGGLSDTQRELWAMDPNLIVGKVVAIEYMEITKAGALRHPRLQTVRGDLS